MEKFYDKIMETSNQLKSVIKELPDIAIILGSGLGNLIDKLEDPIAFDYSDIVNFPTSTVKGHQGQLVFGKFQGKNVLMMAGRFHYYEGYSMKEVTFPVYVFKALGVKNLIVTNSCGGINTEFEPGDLVLIDDFISLVSDNPLMGVNDDRLGQRFVDMTEPYKKELMEVAKTQANILNLDLKTGVYGFFQGPYYETRAEIRAFANMGCDLIGMSTVPETIAANHCGLDVLAISCVTNMATGIQKKKHSHAHVVEVANIASKKLTALIENVIVKL